MQITRRRFLQYGGLAALAATPIVAGVGLADTTATRQGKRQPRGFAWRAQEAAIPSPELHALHRLAYGHTYADLQAMKAGTFNLSAWIDQQLAPDNTENQALTDKLATFLTLNLTSHQLLTQFPQQDGAPPYVVGTVLQELSRATILRKIYSKWQLKEVLVDFWTDHFNIEQGKETCRWLKTVDDREVIGKHALGNFREMLWASAHSPAMMVYLDNIDNTNSGPNENYAREIMELHTLSVTGPYTQQDVQELAKCFTGWRVVGPRDQMLNSLGEFIFDARRHVTGNKRVLGVDIQYRAGANGIQEAEEVLDILANHPATANFIARKLVRKFVSDIVTADDQARLQNLIDHLADVFYTHRAAPNQIALTMRALIESQEFQDTRISADPLYVKIRRPLDYIAAAGRAVDVNTTGIQGLIGQRGLMAAMGQPLFAHAFPDGYPEIADEWVNTNGLLGRWNFGFYLLENRLGRDTTVNLLPWFDTIRPATADALVDAMIDRIIGYAIDPLDRTALINYVNAGATYSLNNQTIRTIKLPELAALLLGSPYFQMR